MKTMRALFLHLKYTGAVLFLLLLGGFVCIAAEQPIQIEADKMTAVEKSQTVIFSGNVDATQGDVRIRSDEMTIFYIEDEMKTGPKSAGKDAQQVEKIICKGNVEVTSQEWLGTSETMHYFSKKNLVQLIGNAKAYKGQNMVQGERIDYDLETGQSEVYGGKTRMEGDEAATTEKSGRVNMTILEE
ncbi:lipopolysaccharide transport periplasmic protein LptA [Desulfopila inferna]|uniref:lipopolysaccharide transport periplasmic protein LptA n=1 Tax=Desulfopila inferna TaxID=468528 RepID=UPI001964115D|nr:lipopolysaccharide transport periplasmic protein LptA [Desulfopila inferna]MBM9604089.1 lipopolysaccharide transport periplasmic protein LptA [Desulfopila inferna]